MVSGLKLVRARASPSMRLIKRSYFLREQVLWDVSQRCSRSPRGSTIVSGYHDKMGERIQTDYDTLAAFLYSKRSGVIEDGSSCTGQRKRCFAYEEARHRKFGYPRGVPVRRWCGLAIATGLVTIARFDSERVEARLLALNEDSCRRSAAARNQVSLVANAGVNVSSCSSVA